jgi:hypothetical protein
LEAVGFATAAAGFRDAPDLEAGLGAGFVCGVLAGRCAAVVSRSGWDSSAAGSDASASALATETELESVRWHVSQVTMVRTSAPSWCCSFLKVRGRPQNEQKATSVVTTT